jgi:hypothetical protein
VAVITSSARPAAIAASQRAVAGATRIASAESAATMWAIRPSGSSSSGSAIGRWRVSVSSVSGPMNACAEWVISGCTSAPAAVSARANSADL